MGKIFKKKVKPLTKKEKVVKYVKENPVEVGLIGLGVGNVVANVVNFVNNNKTKKEVKLMDAKVSKVEKTSRVEDYEKIYKKLEELSSDISKINHSLMDINDMIEFEEDEYEEDEDDENPVIYSESETFGTSVGDIIDTALKKSKDSKNAVESTDSTKTISEDVHA